MNTCKEMYKVRSIRCYKFLEAGHVKCNTLLLSCPSIARGAMLIRLSAQRKKTQKQKMAKDGKSAQHMANDGNAINALWQYMASDGQSAQEMATGVAS